MSRDTARRVLEIEAEAIRQLIPRLDESFDRAVETLLGCTGRVVATGMGKSGFIAQKISATLASTGCPSLFLHPAEATHGDLGRIVKGDVLLAVSNSGDTGEILALVPWVKRLGSRVVALTGDAALAARPGGRRAPRRGGERRGLPARPRPHRLHHRRPRHGRRAQHGARRAARLHRRGLRGASPRRAPGQEAPPRRGRDALRGRHPAGLAGHADEGRALRDDPQAARAHHGHRGGRDAPRDDLGRRPAAADGAARLLAPRPPGGGVHDPEPRPGGATRARRRPPST